MRAFELGALTLQSAAMLLKSSTSRRSSSDERAVNPCVENRRGRSDAWRASCG